MTEAATGRRRRRQVLTDKMVADLPRRVTPYFHPDPELPKHGVRIRPTGPGSYTVIIRDAYAKQRWVKIGSTAELRIAEAREVARGVIRRVGQGLEPFEPPPVKPDTVADVIETYFKRHVEVRGLRSAREKRRIIDRYVLPIWRDRAFTAIGRGDIARLCDAVEDNHGPWVADSVLIQLSAIARWYASRHDTYLPPFVAGMKRVGGEAHKRGRILNDDELKRIWETAPEAGSFGALVKLALLLGQRRAAIAHMKWSDIVDGVWHVPAEKRAKGTGGALRLPELALAIVRDQPRFVSNPYVLPAVRGVGPINDFPRPKARLDKASGVHDWVLHDLRRTARSLLSRAGVRPDISERVLGHVQKGVEGVYDKHSYLNEKADALNRLAALIERIVNPPGDNVVVLHEAAVSS